MVCKLKSASSGRKGIGSRNTFSPTHHPEARAIINVTTAYRHASGVDRWLLGPLLLFLGVLSDLHGRVEEQRALALYAMTTQLQVG